MNREKILFVTSEAVPFIKTGGLADVAGTLPKYFDKDRYDTRVILPKYMCMKEEWKNKLTYKGHFYMELAWRKQYVGILETEIDGIPFYFIDNEYYFAGDKPYSHIHLDIEKFAFFSRAALSALPIIGFKPDIIHCHDWQTGLVPVYLKDTFHAGDFYRDIRSIMTIHNLKFQGIYDKKTVQDATGLSPYYFAPDKLEAYGDANLLKGGIVYADRVTTVSDTYAEEIKTPFYGENLNGLMCARSNVLSGIVNGIDYDAFNPETDPCIDTHFNADNFRKMKVKNKIALQKELGLEEDPKVMMIGIVSRLTDQKGFDLISYVMDELCQDAVQIVVLGTGEEQYENMFRHFAWKYQGKVSANIFYSEELSHRIYASCDAFLMPSLFEPCGLSQLMSLRYGTIPIVRETGGLKDTVEPYNEYEHTGTGFSFANYNAHEMLDTVRYAEQIYYDKKRDWNKLIERAMQKDFSWNASARRYEQLYDDLLGIQWPEKEEKPEVPAVEVSSAEPAAKAEASAEPAVEAKTEEKKPAKRTRKTTAKKPAAKKPAAKKAPAKEAAEKKAPVKEAVAEKEAPVKEAAEKKAPAKEAAAEKETPAKETAEKKAPVKEAVAEKEAPAKEAAEKKAPVKETAVEKEAAVKEAPVKKAAAKKTPVKEAPAQEVKAEVPAEKTEEKQAAETTEPKKTAAKKKAPARKTAVKKAAAAKKKTSK